MGGFFLQLFRWLPLVLLAATGCSGMRAHSAAPLRIGVSPDYPPLAFMRDGQVAGVEIDFAQALGLELNLPVQFVSVPWEKQIDALLAGQTDIIMSGMTRTSARARSVAFAEPYLVTGLRALARREDLARFDTAEKFRKHGTAMGFTAGSTADVFIQQECPEARRVPVKRRADAVSGLANGKLDVYVDDGFVVAELYAANASALVVLPLALSLDSFAWAVRPEDTELLGQVNSQLAQWVRDGTRDAVIDHWMPDLRKIQER